ncbi:MAG: hypothetical protein KatS3mg060_1011 [Dehalococcoidia bacterium]|nr:MAG: hypothetical protein KatS3mg060_1011 [Dehalococcoidia bacterium]
MIAAEPAIGRSADAPAAQHPSRWSWLALGLVAGLTLGALHHRDAAFAALGSGLLVLAVRIAAGQGWGAFVSGLLTVMLTAAVPADAALLVVGPSVIAAALVCGQWTPRSTVALGLAVGAATAGSLAAVVLLPAIGAAGFRSLTAKGERRRMVEDGVLGLVVAGGAAILGFAAVSTIVGGREVTVSRVAAQLLALQGVTPAATPTPLSIGTLLLLTLGSTGTLLWWRGADGRRRLGAALLIVPALILLWPGRQPEAALVAVTAALAGLGGAGLAPLVRTGRRAWLVTAAIGLIAILSVAGPRVALPAVPSPAPTELPPSGLLQPAERLAANAAAAPWDAVFDLPWRDGPLPVLMWYVALATLAIAALPLLAAACRPLPDWGLPLARPFGLLIVGWLAWLMASIPVAPFDRTTIVIAIGGTATVSTALLATRRDLRRGLRARWRQLVGWEIVFAASFLPFVGIRALNPDLWLPVYGGEKPMDLAILTAVARSTVFPPTDPWFAGGTLNYYYFGQQLVGTLARLTGLPPEVAYNLAIPSLFAMTVLAAGSLGRNLAVLAGWPERARLAALLTALFVAVAGNLDLPIQTIGGWLRGDGVAFNYWNSSRMMPEQNTITEFPFFTFLFADLHAHLLALPLTLLALGLALALASGGGVATALAAGLVVGALRATNGWDFPTYLLLAVLAALVPLLGGVTLRSVVRSVLAVVIVIVAGWLAFRPFIDSFELFYRWVVASPQTTPLHQYLAIHGLFLFAIGSLLVAGLRSRTTALARWREGLLVALIGAGVGTAMGFATVVALLLLAAAVLWLWGLAVGAGHDRAGRTLLALFVLTGLLLGAAVDLVTVAGDPTRTNTVFKFYFQAWVLLAIGAGQAAALLLAALRGPWTGGRVAWVGAGMLIAISAFLWPVVATPLRIAQRFAPLPPTLDGLAYQWTAVYVDERGPIELRADREAIEWLRTTGGLASMLEGRTPAARWGGRFSVHTGMPAVLGWEFHQSEQRRGYLGMVGERARDVDRFYSSGDPAEARAILERYRPAFVAVGELEARFYPASGLAGVRSLEGSALEVAYRNEKVTIYRVRTSQP